MNTKQILTIIIPVYNEAKFIEELYSRVIRVKLPSKLSKEVIIIDDNSNDGTNEIINKFSNNNTMIIKKKKNSGKGACIKLGLEKASGNIILIQDADLEYDPEEYPKLLAPIINGEADVVYGSRFKGGEAHRILYYWHSFGNKILTLFSNILTNLNLSDMECCYKVFRKEIIQNINLIENRFGFEPEITAKIAKLSKRGKCRIFEVGVSYSGRTYEEGKKINWTDGVSALKCILKYNLLDS
ncbi:MAG: glycosyltransferase family 2 protein [Candidatus Marinimicrobia bacterium]|nr:glycosyltransferase family 2 protein [Candidatus Neomarinimicrobiota bacterium]